MRDCGPDGSPRIAGHIVTGIESVNRRIFASVTNLYGEEAG
jgi:hypothetical protein